MSTTSRQIVSTLDSDGTLTLEVAESQVPDPTGTQVLVRMEAAPINPSDLAILTGAADFETADYHTGKVVARMPESFTAASKARHGQRLPVGNEGAGTVVASGDAEAARALVGQRVACVPGNAFSEYVIVEAGMCLPLGEHTAEQGASSFVNPMTALGFVETAKRHGQQAIIHLAAASNLGQMLVRICQADGIGLVNVVRTQQQVHLLRTLGADHVVNSSDEDFADQLRVAIDATDAFMGFDPIGGGHMVDACFTAMERVAASRMRSYSRYGSSQPKWMYIYGRLDPGPTILTRSYGFEWTLSGWLLFPFLQGTAAATATRMRHRVLEELTTTFASTYKRRVGLDEMLTKDAIVDYRRVRTGEKYLVTP